MQPSLSLPKKKPSGYLTDCPLSDIVLLSVAPSCQDRAREEQNQDGPSALQLLSPHLPVFRRLDPILCAEAREHARFFPCGRVRSGKRGGRGRGFNCGLTERGRRTVVCP